MKTKQTTTNDDLVTLWIDESETPAHGPRYAPTSVNTLAGSRVYNPDAAKVVTPVKA